MQKYKLIAIDMDGTLLRSDKSISQKTKEALISLQKQGVKLALCSGRQITGMLEAAEILEISKYGGIIAGYNGGKILDAKTNDIIYENSLPNELAVKILKHLEKFKVTPIVDDNKFIYTNQLKDPILRKEAEDNRLIIKEIDNVADYVKFDPIKILVTAPEDVFKNIGTPEEILEPFLNDIDYAFSSPVFLEVNKKGVNKSVAVKKICELLNISIKEVIAFGDGGNDIKMLKDAGLGVAMGNAVDFVKNISDEITLSNNEDGIVHTLSKYFDL